MLGILVVCVLGVRDGVCLARVYCETEGISRNNSRKCSKILGIIPLSFNVFIMYSDKIIEASYTITSNKNY